MGSTYLRSRLARVLVAGFLMATGFGVLASGAGAQDDSTPVSDLPSTGIVIQASPVDALPETGMQVATPVDGLPETGTTPQEGTGSDWMIPVAAGSLVLAVIVGWQATVRRRS